MVYDYSQILVFNLYLIYVKNTPGSRGGLMVSVPDTRSVRVRAFAFVVLLGKTLYMHSASLHPGV